jgi:hypothetical protein
MRVHEDYENSSYEYEMDLIMSIGQKIFALARITDNPQELDFKYSKRA